MRPSLEVKELSFKIASKYIVNNVELSIKKSSFTGIIGPNGSGKSTLMKCIYRVLPASSGTVYLNNENFLGMSIRESARKLAVLAQQNPFDFDFTVEELTLLGRSPYKKMMEQDNVDDYRRAHQSLNMVGMLDMKDREFSTLSGGEQQRTNLARTLTQDTEYLILDEPTNHLDIKHQFSLLKIIKELGKTTFAALHDLNMAAMFCDYIYVLKAGEIVAHGKTNEVITAQLIESVFEVKSKVEEDELGRTLITYLP